VAEVDAVVEAEEIMVEDRTVGMEGAVGVNQPTQPRLKSWQTLAQQQQSWQAGSGSKAMKAQTGFGSKEVTAQ